MTNSISTFAREAANWKSSDAIMPVLFIGHGAPFNAVEDNTYTRAWKEIAAKIPKPKAIICISAHWLTRGSTKITAMPKPKTIHDFGASRNICTNCNIGKW